MHTYNVQAEFQGGFTARRTRTGLLVHHAAALYPQGTGIEDVRAVAHYHTKTRGWRGIGYHICLAEEVQGGPIARYVCSDLSLQRAHVLNRNHLFLGVSCLTNFNLHPNKLPEQKWFDALVDTLRMLKTIYPSAPISGHTDEATPEGATSCPGERWKEWKVDLLKAVAGPIDLFAGWGKMVPLDPAAHGFAVPQLWLKTPWLGQCRKPETYTPNGFSITRFQHGAITYEQATNSAVVYPMEPLP